MTLLCIWSTLFLAGCDVKDPIYNTPHPDKGAIVITADWTRRGEGIAAPAEYITEAAEHPSPCMNRLPRLPDYSCRDRRNCSATTGRHTLR